MKRAVRASAAAVPSTMPTAPLTSVSHSVVRAPSENAWALLPMGSGRTESTRPSRDRASTISTSAETSVALLRCWRLHCLGQIAVSMGFK